MIFSAALLVGVMIAMFAVSECAPSPAYSNGTTNSTIALKFVTLEEHYDPQVMTPYQTDAVYELLIDALGDSTTPLLHNINGSRLDSMNANGIRVQVIANDPTPAALEQPDVVSAANNEIATAIAPYPSRFRAFCFLPMAYPELAAAELSRCVSTLGFLGALVDSHLLNNTSYDSPTYNPLWETLQRLNVPIYLHPTYPPIQQVNQTGGIYAPDNNNIYPATTASVLATAGWGWHSDCGVQFLKLWLSGVFDRYPDLKIVLGHMGEMLPFMFSRANFTLGAAKTEGASLPDTYARNVWVTTSGFFNLEPFKVVLGVTARDRIMYSVDYPWATNEDGTAFMQALQASGMVTDEEWEAIAHGNAEKFLGLD